MLDVRLVILAKSLESLAGAESEFVLARCNNRANRCYYACFQAAIAALIQAGIGPRSSQRQWGHDFVQAEVIGQLINRRKVYPPTLRDILERAYTLQQVADYQVELVTERQASRALHRARQLVEAIAGDENA